LHYLKLGFGPCGVTGSKEVVVANSERETYVEMSEANLMLVSLESFVEKLPIDHDRIACDASKFRTLLLDQ
jgi:hypothetical protein